MHRNHLAFLLSFFFFYNISINIFGAENVKVNNTIAKRDVKIKEPITKVHPRIDLLRKSKKEQQEAMLLSMFLPCVGQIYNKSYLTAGIFGVLFGITAGWTIYNHNLYIEKGKKNIENIENISRFRDLGFCILGLLYVLNIVEAYTTASLKTFDISDDLSFIISPEEKLKMYSELK